MKNFFLTFWSSFAVLGIFTLILPKNISSTSQTSTLDDLVARPSFLGEFTFRFYVVTLIKSIADKIFVRYFNDRRFFSKNFRDWMNFSLSWGGKFAQSRSTKFPPCFCFLCFICFLFIFCLLRLSGIII
jgi:hypothetical protein